MPGGGGQRSRGARKRCSSGIRGLTLLPEHRQLHRASEMSALGEPPAKCGKPRSMRTSFPGTNSRSTPLSVMIAIRIVPPELPSLAIANAKAVRATAQSGSADGGDRAHRGRGRTVSDEFDRLVFPPSFAVRRVAVAVDVRRSAPADRPRLLEEPTSERNCANRAHELSTERLKDGSRLTVVYGPVLRLGVPPRDDDAR